MVKRNGFVISPNTPSDFTGASVYQVWHEARDINGWDE